MRHELNYSRFRRSSISPALEKLEGRRLLTTIGFVPHVISQAELPRSVEPADVDGDGDLDLLIATKDHAFQVYNNRDGEGTFELAQSLAPGPTLKIRAGDLDGDGDLDAVVVWNSSVVGGLGWSENVDGRGTFARATVIDVPAIDESGVIESFVVLSIELGDIDGDRELDVLASTTSGLLLYFNTDGDGAFSEPWTVDAVTSHALALGDFDGDTDLDLLTRRHDILTDRTSLIFIENLDGLGDLSQQVEIAQVEETGPVIAADLDGDQDLDIVSSDSNWYENVDGQATFVERERPKHPLEFFVGDTMVAGDLDRDLDLDLLIVRGRDESLGWQENTDGLGNFGADRSIPAELDEWFSSVAVADLDGDSDLDVVAASSDDDTVVWLENRIAGDANDDGRVEFADFLVLSAHYGAQDAAWEDGDFNSDGQVSFADFLILSANFA